ncbi:MAG: ABC transporter substrate-binding protein [Streptosporangiaceae bacterium]
MKHGHCVLAISALLGVGLAACSSPTGTSSGSSGGGGGGAQIKDGGHLTVALAEAPDALDPTTAQTYVGRIVFINMCEKLYDINAQTELVPQLASGMPQISDGGKTYTIHLRKNIKFNDGTPFNAQAVKTTLERDINNKRSSRASSLTAIDKVTVVDPSTVKLHLKRPYAPLTSILAARAGMILSPAQLKKLGNDFSDHPVCVGPFSFDSRPSSDRIELKKSKYYYDKDKVHLDRVTFKVVGQPSVRSTNLRAGAVDVAGRLQPSDVASLKSNPDVQLKMPVSLGYQGITINVSNTSGAGKPSKKPADNPLAKHQQLRQALALSLNRQQINQVVFNGLYKPGCSPISPASPFFTGVPCPKQDLAKAKQLVKASGVKTPIPVTLIVEANNQLATKLGQVIQNMAKKAGFDVKVKPTEFTTSLKQSQAGDFETFHIGWSGRVDPDQNIAPFWEPTSLLNYSGANYDDVTALMDKARATTDMGQRKQIYRKLVQTLNQHLNIIYLYHEREILGVSGKVAGVHYYADNLIRLKTAGFTSGG